MRLIAVLVRHAKTQANRLKVDCDLIVHVSIMSISVHLEFPGGPSDTVTCIGDPLSVPLTELIRINAGKLSQSAVRRRFGDTAVTATAAETKALKAAGAVPSRSHDIRIVRLTALGAGVVSTVLEPEDSDSESDDRPTIVKRKLPWRG